MTKHLKAIPQPHSQRVDCACRGRWSFNPVCKIKRGLTKREALRLEGQCYEKWLHTLCNRNHPYPALELERMEAEWEEAANSDFGREHQAWMDAVEAMYDGTLPREKALQYGFIDAKGRVTYGAGR